MGDHIIAFQGGGQDGTFLSTDGEHMTRDRAAAKRFPSAMDARAYATDYRLMGWNRPRRSVRIEEA